MKTEEKETPFEFLKTYSDFDEQMTLTENLKKSTREIQKRINNSLAKISEEISLEDLNLTIISTELNLVNLSIIDTTLNIVTLFPNGIFKTNLGTNDIPICEILSLEQQCLLVDYLQIRQTENSTRGLLIQKIVQEYVMDLIFDSKLDIFNIFKSVDRKLKQWITFEFEIVDVKNINEDELKFGIKYKKTNLDEYETVSFHICARGKSIETT